MTETVAFFQKALLMTIWLSLPPLIVAVVVGILTSLLQTLLSLQDQALPFAFKLLAVGLTLAVAGRWMALELIGLGDQALLAISTFASHGGQGP